MAKQRSKKAEKAEVTDKLNQAKKPSAHSKIAHSPSFTLEEIQKMGIGDVIELFTEFEVLNKVERKFKLRCHLLGENCSHLSSARSLKQCKAEMGMHLENHVKSYASKLSRNPKFYSKLKFVRYSDAGPVKHKDGKREGSPATTLTSVGQKQAVGDFSNTVTSKRRLLTPMKLLNNSNNASHRITLDSSQRENIFSVLSRELLPTVIVDKIELSPEKKDLAHEFHDAYDCHCENDGDEICSSKQALLSTLRLERIRLKPDDSSAPSSTVSSEHCSPKILRTRSQRKRAILERIYRKHQAAVAPCRLRKRLSSLSSTQPSAVSKIKTPRKQVSRKNMQQRSPRNCLLIRLRQATRSTMKREGGGFFDLKGYNLRRAKQLKQTANNSKQAAKPSLPKISPQPSPSHKKEVYNPVGEVVRMPIESMLELMEEERRFAQEQSESEESPSDEPVSPPKILPSPKKTLCKFSQPDRLRKMALSNNCRPNVFHRPRLEHESASTSQETRQPMVMVRVNGKLVQIKAEPLSDDEQSIGAEFFTRNPEGAASPKPGDKKTKMTVSSLLFRRRMNAINKGTACDKSSDSTSEDEDESADGDCGISAGGAEEDEDGDVNVTSVSDCNDSDHERLRLPPSPSKILPATMVQWQSKPTAGHSASRRKKSESFPMKLQQTLEEIRKEIEEAPVPQLTAEEISLVALYNDHTYASKEVDCIRKMDNILSKVKLDDIGDEDHLIQTRLTEEEMKIREKALVLLRHIRYKDKKKEMIAEGDEIVKDGEDLACKICKKRFTASNSLYYHYRSHAGVKPYKCDICHKTFTRLHSLNYHAMIHTNSTRFKCKYCNRGFRHPSHFKEHLNKHTGEEPYDCSMCGRKFKTSNTHRRHMMSKHHVRPATKYSRRVLPRGLRIGRYMERPRSPTRDNSRSLACRSPPLPDSPPPTMLPIKPFAFTQPRPVRLILFPKNGIFRYTEL